MPTEPTWDIGFTSEEMKWYILPWSNLSDRYRLILNDSIDYADTMIKEIKLLSDEALKIAEAINREERLELSEDEVSYIPKYEKNLNSLAQRLSELRQYAWEDRLASLKAQKNNTLTDKQKTHNLIRNCEETCFTCRWNRSNKFCVSGFGRKKTVINSIPNLRE